LFFIKSLHLSYQPPGLPKGAGGLISIILDVNSRLYIRIRLISQAPKQAAAVIPAAKALQAPANMEFVATTRPKQAAVPSAQSNRR
jgi:hypothetical protein